METAYAGAYDAVRSLGSTLGIETDLPKDQLIRHAEMAATLPAFSKASMEGWIGFGENLIAAMANDVLENNPVLRKIGEKHADKYLRGLSKQRSGRVDLREVKKFRDAGRAANTRETNIRNGIDTLLKSAFKTLAGHVGKTPLPNPSKIFTQGVKRILGEG